MWHATLCLLVIAMLSPWPVDACSPPPVERGFDAIAPGATDIVAVQVESLALDRDNQSLPYSHTFRGKIRILKRFRGSGEFVDIKFRNDHCAGLRIDVGGIYLIATSSVQPTIELDSRSAPILPLLDQFPFDTDAALRVSHAVKQLEAALRGDGTFAITTDDMRWQMSTFTPPPGVPRP